jgi:hypothetical protein
MFCRIKGVGNTHMLQIMFVRHLMSVDPSAKDSTLIDGKNSALRYGGAFSFLTFVYMFI